MAPRYRARVSTQRADESLADDSTATPAIRRRREIVADLGAAVRELTQAVVDTEVDDAVLADAAARAREATALLTAVRRPAHQLSPVEDLRPGRRVFSPISGPGNPVSPPVRTVHGDPEALRIEAECTLHRVHEGPPTYGHGGMSAMILDQLLGQAIMLAGRVGLTRTLAVRYRRPVPLGVPLTMTAQVTERHDTRMVVTGTIATQAAPDDVLVEADGTFLVPRPDQVSRLFGHVEVFGAGQVPTGD